MRRLLATALLLLLAGCTSSAPGRTATAAGPTPVSSTASGTVVSAAAELPCAHAIDGSPPPKGFQVVLSAVALPASPGYPTLQAGDSGLPGGPRLFAKTGLLVRAGVASTLEVAARPGNRIGIGWGNPGPGPTRRLAVPACPDALGTGWLVYPGGYWVDQPLCLPLTVRAGGRAQQILIGVGAACPGQAPVGTG